LKIGPYLSLCIQINSEQICDLKVRPESRKLLQENML
jgi:hypothetical protein